MVSFNEDTVMSCFDDLMQFRDEVEEARKKIPDRRAVQIRLMPEDPSKREEENSLFPPNPH